MGRILRTPIKEIIAEHPPVGTSWRSTASAGVPCNVGTCLLADIVEIHNLSPKDEGELMARIATVVFPDGLSPCRSPGRTALPDRG